MIASSMQFKDTVFTFSSLIGFQMDFAFSYFIIKSDRVFGSKDLKSTPVRNEEQMRRILQ